MNENNWQLTKDSQDKRIHEDSENLDVVAPEGNSFEFLTQPEPEENYEVEVNYEKEVSQFKIPGEIENRKKSAARRRSSLRDSRTYASVVSESENEDQDQPEDGDKSGILGDDSVIICDEEVNSATGRTSPKENGIKRVTRSTLKNENEDKDSEECENGESAGSQIKTDLNEGDAKSVSNGAEDK